MTRERHWQILSHIANGNSAETLKPPLKPEEQDFYDMHKEQYDEAIKRLPEGVHFSFVPANDPDSEHFYDE
jgi:hypothetical protein